jgi:hypothetical protein
MKNVHILPTDKPSRLLLSKRDYYQFLKDNASTNINNHFEGNYQNIYITSDEEIKAGDYFWKPDCNMIFKAEYTPHKGCQKIILTTDFTLAPNVHKISDEFLEWFVKNPSCEFVEVYEVEGKLFAEPTIPQEEPNPFELPKALPDNVFYDSLESKQETLEEAAENNYPEGDVWTVEQAVVRRLAFMNGANWEAKKSYSEEELLEFANWCRIQDNKYPNRVITIQQLFTQFKKK